MPRPDSKRPRTRPATTSKAAATNAAARGPAAVRSVSRAAARADVLIRCKARLLRPARTPDPKPVDWTFLRLPQPASDRLSSRGMVSIRGSFHGVTFAATLNPDGEGGHWLRVEDDLRTAAAVVPGDLIKLDFAQVPPDEEPEPVVPPDLRAALAAASPSARDTWADITPAARRDFIHWITSPKRPETRTKRIETACDMLAQGKRRPCCFDRSGKFDKSQTCPVAAPTSPSLPRSLRVPRASPSDAST